MNGEQAGYLAALVAPRPIEELDHRDGMAGFDDDELNALAFRFGEVHARMQAELERRAAARNGSQGTLS